MAKKQTKLNLSELIAAQERRAALNEPGSVDALARLKSLQEDDARSVPTDDAIKKSLTDTKGEGLNSNVIKLTQSVKKSFKDIEKTLGKSKVDSKGFAVSGSEFGADKWKKLLTLEGWFKRHDKPGGMLDAVVQRKMVENDYVRDQKLANPEVTSSKALREEFRGINNVKGKKAKLELEIGQLRAAGESDERIQELYGDKMSALDNESTPRQTFARRIGSIESVEQTESEAPKKSKRAKKDSWRNVDPSMSSPVSDSSEELRNEQAIADESANKVFHQIEANTRPIGDILKLVQRTVAAVGTAAAVGIGSSLPDSGGFLGKAKDFLGKGAGRAAGGARAVGGSMLRGAGSLLRRMGPGAAAGLVGEGVQMGGDALEKAGYTQTGKAVSVLGTAGKYAGAGAMVGSMVPVVGTGIGAAVGGLIGTGKGIYDEYFADEEPQSRRASRRAMRQERLRTADQVSQQSAENSMMAPPAPPVAPVIVSAPTSNVNTTNTYAPVSPARNTDSSIQQYNQSRFGY